MRKTFPDVRDTGQKGRLGLMTQSIVTLNARTSFGVACRDANHLIHTPSISA